MMLSFGLIVELEFTNNTNCVLLLYSHKRNNAQESSRGRQPVVFFVTAGLAFQNGTAYQCYS